MTQRDTPRLSVVIASATGSDFLFRCLDSLEGQAEGAGAELIVVDRCGDAWRERVRERFPTVTVLAWPGAERPSVPQLRACGVDASQAEIVAIIEEHCVAPDDWMDTILAAFEPNDSAIGGPIRDHEFKRLRDWAVYFAEYHNDLPPWEAGERSWLNDANAAYARRSLIKHRAILGDSYWAIALHPRLVADGARMRSVPAMGVRHTGPFNYGYYLRQRYLLSRLWGGTQRDRVGIGRRLMHLGAAPIFPFYLLARIARRVHSSGSSRLLKWFLATLPLLGPVVIAYTWGEWLGYLVGPGRAAEEVE
jgi:hypothetical protein